MDFYVLTLFPEMINAGLTHSVTGRAINEKLINVTSVNIRDYADNSYKQVDDYPYGGGAGMVMQPSPVYEAYSSIKSKSKRVVCLTPQGTPLTQRKVEEFSKEEALIILCGHYEGIDERVIEEIVTDEISIGDYILTGGELAAMVLIDSIARLVPGVLGKSESYENESFGNGLLEYPQYTRPLEFLGRKVPEILLSGHHKKIEEWRLQQSINRTQKKRLDLYHNYKQTNPLEILSNELCKISYKDTSVYISNDFSSLSNVASMYNGRKFCIITDSNVSKLYMKEVVDILTGISGEVYCYIFEAGEKYKTNETVLEFYKYFIEKKLDRKSVIVALGGGVTGDLAGYAAATYMRGISCIQIPTTLLAQVDSSIGGKTGYDFLGNKNMVGAFYQPELVYINTGTLKTLPSEQFSSGMGEIIKHGLINDTGYYDFIIAEKERIKQMKHRELAKLVTGSCMIKSKVVSADEKEQGLREILNFGHTVGHAIEALSEYLIPHGKCVALGMCAALHLSYDRGSITKGEWDLAESIMEYFSLPTKIKLDKIECNEADWEIIKNNIDEEKIFTQMFLDKKSKDNKINMVLLKVIGEAYTDKNIPEDNIRNAIKYLF